MIGFHSSAKSIWHDKPATFFSPEFRDFVSFTCKNTPLVTASMTQPNQDESYEHTSREDEIAPGPNGFLSVDAGSSHTE